MTNLSRWNMAGQEKAPCYQYKCPHVPKCADERLDCSAFRAYANLDPVKKDRVGKNINKMMRQ